jgi:heptosyltransferase-3
MKILHLVSGATMTGPADPALCLASAQRKLLGHDVFIAFDQIREGNMRQKVASFDVPVFEGLAICTKGGLRNAFRDRQTLRRIADEFDIIHCHTSHDHGLAALARGRAKLIRSIHHPRSIKKRSFQHIAYDRTDGFVFVAQAHRKEFLENYPQIHGDATVVVPGAVDPELFRPDVDCLVIRRELNIPEDAIVIGMIARFQTGRGQNLLIEAFARARKKSDQELCLALIGKGETERDMRACVQRFDLEDVTRFYGFRDHDLPEAIRSCDVTVLLREGNDASCRAILQSMSAGVPVIGARYAAIEDALDDEEFGVLIDPDDVYQLTNAILDFSMRDRQSAGEAARSAVLAKYTENARARAVDEFYGLVVNAESMVAAHDHREWWRPSAKTISGFKRGAKTVEKWLAKMAVKLGRRLAQSRRPKPALLDGIQSILVLRIDERLGNVLLTTPLIERLRAEIPWADVDFLVASSKRAVVRDLVGVIAFEKRDFFKRPWRFVQLLWSLRKRNYDVVIDASHWHSFSSTSALLLAVTGAPMRIAHDRGEARHFTTDLVAPPAGSESELSSKLRLLLPMEIDGKTAGKEARMDTSLGRSGGAQKKIAAWLSHSGLGQKPLIGLMPGSRKLGHRADISVFEGLAREGLALDADVVVLWGPDEAVLARDLVQLCGGAHLAPPTSVEELAALIRVCTLIVANDTGTMHLAVAVETPTLGLFVKSDPARWGHNYDPHSSIDGRSLSSEEILVRARERVSDRLRSL